MLGTGLNLITTVIGFGMSATFIIFICARLICGRIRSSESRAAALSHELHSDLYTTEYSFHGRDPVDLAAIPTMKYCREAFRSKEDAQGIRRQRDVADIAYMLSQLPSNLYRCMAKEAANMPNLSFAIKCDS